MHEIAPQPVTSLVQVSVPPDNSCMIAQFGRETGEDIAISIPGTELTNLLYMTSQAMAEIKRAKNTERQVIPTESLEIGRARDGESIFLSFRIPGGGELSFQVRRETGERLIEVLSVALGKGSTPAPDGPRH